MSVLVQVVVTGLGVGGVYGLLAVGHALVYRLTGTIHFALGDLIGLAVFVTLAVAVGSGPVTQTNIAPVRFALALAVGVVACVAASVATFLFAIDPFVGRSSVLWIGSMLAVAFAIRGVLESFFPRQGYVFPDPFPFRRIGRGGVVDVAGASFHVRTLYVAALAVALAGLAVWTLERTRFGRGLQAVAADSEAAALVGVPIARYVALAFALAGGVAAVAAIAAAPSAAVSPGTGTLLGLEGLVAALVVRFGSPWRAFAAGEALGLLESAIANVHLGGLELGPAWSRVLPLGLVLLALALRPPREALLETE